MSAETCPYCRSCERRQSRFGGTVFYCGTRAGLKKHRRGEKCYERQIDVLMKRIREAKA